MYLHLFGFGLDRSPYANSTAPISPSALKSKKVYSGLSLSPHARRFSRLLMFPEDDQTHTCLHTKQLTSVAEMHEVAKDTNQVNSYTSKII